MRRLLASFLQCCGLREHEFDELDYSMEHEFEELDYDHDYSSSYNCCGIIEHESRLNGCDDYGRSMWHGKED